MKRKRQLIFLVLLLTLFPLILASAGASFDLSWWSVDSGGGQALGGGYTLQGAIGQPDAGQMRGGNFSLSGGYFSGAMQQAVYLPHLTKP